LRRLIVTADDFGLSIPVNQAIEQAHREGILSTTSLMVGAPCADDAVQRARRNPDLGVGLHLVVARGRAVLPAAALPDITDAGGRLDDNLVRAGVRYFFLPRCRAQLEAEVRAQFRAFRDTDLPLDHVNGHNHMHLHPTVFSLLLRLGPEFGMAAVRLPREPLRPFLAAGLDTLPGRLASRLFLAPWAYLLAARLRRAKLRCNDHLFGLFDTGRMSPERVLALLPHLPEGVSEMYFHPAADGPGDRPLADPAACLTELQSLLSAEIRARLEALGIVPSTFSGLAAARGTAPDQHAQTASR
jgi:hopanoid biosynthesis associated protein HpnK